MNANLGSGDLLAGRYRLVEELGRGGMGVVWRASDEVLGRDVAVKEVKAPAGLEEDQVRQLYARLEQEGRAAARVDHPNVITVYDVATEDGRPWIVMELVRGLSLADVLEAEGPMAPDHAADVGGKVLAALRAGHTAGVLHRDVKPGNVLIAGDGRVVLTDFGIAVIEGSSSITRTGELVGSPEFLAPERALGRSPGAASDLWSLGVTLYAAVEGKSPFRRTTALTTLQAVVDEELPPPQRAGALGPVIEGLLRKDPDERIDGEHAQRMLDEVAAGGPGHPGTVVAGPAGLPPTVGVDTPQPTNAAPVGSAVPAPVPVPVPGSQSTQAAQPVGAGKAGATGGAGGSGGTPIAVIGHQSDGGERRRRIGRVRIALVAAMVVLALAGGSIAVASLSNGDKGANAGSDGRRASAGTTAGSGQSPGPTADQNAKETADQGQTAGTDGGAKNETTTGASGTTGNTTGGHTNTHVDVTVHVSAVRDYYSGACPPPSGQEPYFQATITVSATPAQVQYRWVTGGGSTDGWKVLDFPSGGGKSKTVEFSVVAHESVNGWVAVEISSPKAVTSHHASYSVNCDAPSTGGTSTTGGSSTTGGTSTTGGASTTSGGGTSGGYSGGGAAGGTTESAATTDSADSTSGTSGY